MLLLLVFFPPLMLMFMMLALTVMLLLDAFDAAIYAAVDDANADAKMPSAPSQRGTDANVVAVAQAVDACDDAVLKCV